MTDAAAFAKNEVAPEDDYSMRIYCPACGIYSDYDDNLIAPGGPIDWTCPECGTVFGINIEFVPYD